MLDKYTLFCALNTVLHESILSFLQRSFCVLCCVVRLKRGGVGGQAGVGERWQ
jgi:hypothetical protein